MSEIADLTHIYQHPLLNPNDLKRILDAHEKVAFSKGNFLLHEGKTANEYFVLEKGLMRSFVFDFEKNDITTDFFIENEIVIEVSSLFQRIAAQENIQALTDCVLWKIDFGVFQELFHSIESFREWGRGGMSYQLFKTKQRPVEMITKSATERYLKLLKERPQIIQQAPLKQIATYLGITDTSLSRIRKEISEK